MNVEDVLRTQLHETSHQIPLRTVNLDGLVHTARRGERVRRAALAVTVAACVGLGAVGVTSLLTDRGPKGERVAPAGAGAAALSPAEAHDLVDRFINRLEAGDAQGARALLTPAASARAGDRAAFLEEMRPLRTFLGWIPAPDVETTVTSLTTGSGERHVATFAAPVEGDKALLQPMVIEVVDGEPLLDLPSVTLDRAILLEPEAPQFFACASDDTCDLWEMWPPVSDGDTFSVLLSPGAKVQAVWFAVGGNAWAARASLSEAGDAVRAEATFGATDVDEGINVFLVAIETDDGVLETYGYRVAYERIEQTQLDG